MATGSRGRPPPARAWPVLSCAILLCASGRPAMTDVIVVGACTAGLAASVEAARLIAVRNHGSALNSPAGLDVDTRLRVRGAEGPISNLFAAGEVIGGSRLSGKSFVSGMSGTPALSFGRLLARQVAGLSVDPGSM